MAASTSAARAVPRTAWTASHVRGAPASASTGTSTVGVWRTVLDDRLTIACADGAIRPVLVQRAGRSVTTTEELLRGFPIASGTRL